MENKTSNTTAKPISKLKIGGEVKHVDQQFLQDNLDRFSQKYGNETVYVTNPDGQKGYIPISQLRTALDEGYTLFDDAANIQIPASNSPKTKSQEPQVPHSPTPGEIAVEKTIGANTRNQIGHTFSTLNQGARSTMQDIAEQTANLPQVPKIPGQTNIEYAEAVAAATDKVMEDELERQQKQMQDLALPTTRAEIDKQLNEIDGELATLGQQRYGKLDANPAYGNPMLMGIDANAHKRAELYSENKERIDELQRQRAALESQVSFLNTIEKYNEYDRKGDKSGISNFFRAIKVGGDLQALASFGLSKMQEDLGFAQILERAHKGETLTLDEKKALQMYTNMKELAAMDRGAHFNAGLGMQQTFEFMRDIFLAGMTGGASAGNLIAQYGVKGAIKQLGKNTAKKAAEVYLKTALTPSFYKNLTSAMVDNYDLKYYGGDTFGADKKRSGLSLLYRTWAETGAEYFTESISGLIGNIGIAKRIAKTARGKGMLSKAMRTFDEIHDRTKQNPIGGKILEGLSKIGVGNIPEELLEEIAVVPLQSITLGENRMKQLLDPRFYQEVLISTAAIGGMNSATNILVGGTTAAIEKRKTNNKIKEIRTSLDESLRNSNEAVQSAYDRFISNLENENFYDEEGVFAPESILDDLQVLRDATNNDEAVMSQAEEYAKYHIFKQGQTEALRTIAEEELGPIEYGNSASVVPFLDMADGKTYHKLGETKDVVILGTNDKSIPGGKIVVPRSSLNGKELDPIPISEYVTDYFISKPTPTKVETLDDVSEIRQQGANAAEPVISPEEPAPSADGVQHSGGVAAPSNVINVGDTASYGERVVKVVDIYENDDKKLEATIEDENGEQHVVSFDDLAPVVHQDNSTKTRYILPDGRRAVVQSSNGDNVTLGVLDDNNQVVEEIPSTMEEVLALDKVQAEEAEVIETAAAEMAAGGTETPQIGTETAPSGTENLPRDKKGNIDYDALLTQSPTRFVEQMRSEFGTEVADVQLGKMVGNIDAKITKLQEKADKETSPNKVASMLKEIRNLQGQRDAISAALASVQQPVIVQEPVSVEAAQITEEIAPNANNIASDATVKDTTGSPIRLSDEIDENGRRFVLSPNGTVSFGDITDITGLTPAPILLSEGLITNPVSNDGYGLVHIEARHGKQIRDAGYKSVVDFIDFVAKNYEKIRLGKDRDGNQTYMLQLPDEHNNTLMVELSGDGTYWNINTAGIFKKTYGAKNKVVYDRHTTEKQSVETAEASQIAEQSDTQTTSSMNAPTTTDDKDTTISKTSSGVEEKNLTNPKENRTETEPKPKKTILENAQDTVESAEIDAAAQEVNTEPTEAQKEAGNYKKGHTIIQGLNISIEQPKGSTRSGKDPDGKKWSVKMNNHYGYIRGTQGKDKDHIDVFIGDSPTSKKVFVVDQVGRDGSFDEHKVMIGFDTLEEAKAAYLSNYEEGWQGLGAITETSMDGFKEWISDGTPKTRRFAEYAQGIPESYMKRAAQWQKKLGIGITIYNSIDDIKEKSVQEQLRAGIGVSGWISRDDNGALKEIGIYLPYINSKADVDKTAIHEIVAHYGLKGLLGEDKYNELCDNVWELMRPYEQDQYLHYPGVNNARQAADEYIAHLAETLDPDTLSRSDKSIWEKIVEAVKNIFAPHKKTDVDLTDAISEADLSTLLRASYARLASESGKKTQPKKPSKFKLEDAVLKEKYSPRPALTGIYHDSGYKVATDTNVLVALKEDYPESAEGKVYVKGKPIQQSNFPKWQILFNDKFEKSNIPVDFDKLIEKLSTIKKNEGKMPYYVSLKANDGQVYYYHPDRLMIFAKAAKEIGGELMMQRIDQGVSSGSAKLIITSPRGKAIIMPMGKIGDSANIYDISFVDESTPVAQFVEKYETKENQTETKPKPKKTKEKPTASKEVSSTPSKGKVQDQKIEDFGEKIGGARKDVARQRVRDAVNLTNVDLQKLADPDKILSKANIIKSLREGTMTKEDAITLMAMNNTVRCADSTEKYIMMPKYRDMALAWTNGQSPIFHITDKDIEDRFDQIGEHIKARMSDAQVEKHKQNIKKYYDILYGYYSDYIKTYRDLDYPNVERKLAGAIIRKFSHDDSFWVLKKADARRGRIFRTMEAAIAYMKREYPVVVAKAKEDKTSADDSQKVGHLRVVKDSTGWFRIKSSEIPGEIYFSKSFSSRKGAEEYLQENRDMLIAKEQRAIDALMGSNIGMAERQGPDYRNGKDITSDEYLKAFGFRGVEFGNWVPQAERQMYLNKSYDAIMDICSILGISPKAFSLGGKLAIAFGARGHSKAMAHYESSKQVINLTRMKGVGSFAHEWFHAIDNYLARENSGNTMEFVTEKHPTKRQELYDAFNEFVSKMNTLDYTRRSRRAGDYWGSVIERAARMFESYIYTELGAKDISSPLLVDSHSVLSDEYLVDSDISSYPIPTAEETRQIKPYLDKIFSTIQEEVDADDNHILFRVAENVGSFEDTISNAKDKGYENLSAYPDVTNQMLEDALTSGRIMVYSKDPIAGGTTVSPSVQRASELSGPDAQIYSKDISIDQVAWETPDEGTYTTNDDIRFRFIGEQGAANLDRAEEATIRMDNLAVAREMETAGKDAKTIKIATGWERGADKKWRYEVDDDIEFDSPVDRLEMLKEEYASVVRDKDKIIRLLNMYPTKGRTEQQKEQIKQLDKKHKSLIAKTDALLDSIHDAERELSGMSLEDLIGEDNNLFKEYPQLADINVSFIRNSRFGNYRGFYSPSENTIWISPDNGQPASTLVHELQHAIQHIEGFARGGNTSTGNELRDKAKAWSWKKQLEETEKEHPELAGSIRLQATLEDEYKADGMEDKMPSKEIRTTGFNLYVRGYDNEGYESAYDQWEKIGLIDNPKDYSTYKRLAGEVEARNVQTRKWMPASVRRESLAVDTEYDVSREDQIFIMDGIAAQNDVRFRAEGLESLVERTYRKDGSFSFSGKNKIESTDDVAFIFKQLEDSSIENAFLVFVKEGKPTILHVGMGNVSQSIVDSSVVLPAYKDFGADKVYMVHNHPSGNLVASKPDIDMILSLKAQLPKASVEGIIINTLSGNYAVINDGEIKPILETQDTVELEMLSFSKNVFSPEYKSTMAERKISGPESIAAYLSAHRLGSGSKVGALLLNRSNVINGNLVTNSNEVSTENAQELAREIAEAANRCSATSVVLFGDFDYSDKAIAKLQRQIPIVSGMSVNMLDIVRLNGKHTQSLNDMTLPSRSTLSDGVRFRVEQTKDRVENLFTAAISGSFRGKPISIGNLTLEGKKYLESISGIKFKDKVDFVLNPSDLIHMYNEHYGDNEKDPGNNIPLTINDIRNIVDVILTPEKVIYLGEDEGKRFAFLAPAGNGAYNLIEIYATKKGNLSSKTFYKTKKGVSHRAMILKKESKHSTSETNEATLSDAKVPILFDVANISENTVFRISDQNTLRDNLQAAITGYIVGTNTTGDVITTDDMVNTIYDYVENAGESSLKSNLVKELDAYEQNIQSGELNDGVISAEELLIENVHDIINMYSDEVMFRISNENQKVFISNAEHAVRNINMGKAPAEQWLKTIEKAGGLKAGEDKWIGLSDWLKSKGKDTLTKDEVLQFIGDNRIIIQEQHYLEEIDYDADDQKQIDAMNEEFLALRGEAEEAGEWIHDAAEIAYMQMADKYGDDFTIGFGVDSGKLYVANIEAASTITGIAPRPERLINATRLDYTTNGLDDNHEIALIVPTIESWNRTDDLHFGDAGDGRAIAWIRFGETTIQDPLTPEAIAADKARADFIAEKKAKYGENYLSQLTEEEKEQFKPLLHFSSAYKQAAARKVLVIDEIQSKRHQEGREKGYKGDFALTKEKVRLSAELDKKYERRGSLIRERENERDGEMYEIERINQALLEVRNIRDYDRLMAERDAITQKQQTRNDEILAISSEIRELEKELGELAHDFGFSIAIPDAPFEKNWHELAMKRMLRYAAENGFDKIAWTKGEQQAERYNIGNIVSSIMSYDTADGKTVVIRYKDNENTNLSVNNNGQIIDSRGLMSYDMLNKNLSDVVGKEISKKILNGEGDDITYWDGKNDIPAKEISGEGLRVGGEGMKSFYDRMLPSFMNKYGKKWGVKVEDIFLPNLESNGITMHSVDVTPEMKESVMQGQVMFRADQDPLVQNEMQSIIDAAKANGTYMKAPNGKQSNLSPEQWAMVRTENFKRWFGDWEKAARIEKLRKSNPIIAQWKDYSDLYELNKDSAEDYILNNLRGSYLNEDTKTNIHISRKSAKVMHHDVESDVHLKSVALIPEMIKKSIFITEEKNNKSDKFDSYRYYLVGINLDGVDYTAKLVIGVKGQNTYYDHALTQIEKSDLINQRDLVNAQVYDNKTTLSGVKDKRLISILQTDASKIVDENGEPMVVYHGSVSENITAFDKEKIRINETDASYNGFWFSTDPDTSPAWRNAKRVYPVFLNLRNPIIRKDAEKIAREYLKTDAAFDSIGDNGIRGAADAVRAKIQREGYDGVIHFGKPSINIDEFNRTGQTIFSTSDGVRYIISKEEDGINVYEYSSYEPDYKGDFNTSVDTIEEFMDDSYFFGEEIYVVFEPSQIKSATDNIGTFDPANPDIRFRAVPTTTAEDIDKNGFHSYLSEKDYDRMKKEILKGAPILRMSLYTPDEYISSVIDKLTQQSPSDATEALQMASSVRDAFTRAGIVLDMSDNEIIYALWKEVNPSDAVTIKEKLEHNHKSNDVRYRIDSSIGPNTNDIKLSRGEQFRENWVDKMVTVKMFQDLVKKRGGSVDDNLNPYITENLSLGRQQREYQQFQENIYRPMVEQVTAVEKLFVEKELASEEDAYKAVNDFLYARHAPERNRVVMINEIENYITRVITPEEMKFISGDNPRAEIRALATRIYNVYANGVADTSEVFAKNMLNTRYKSKDLNERLKEFRNKFLSTVKGAKEYTEKVFNSKKGTNRSGMSDKEAKEILDKYYVKSTQAELDKLSDLVRESTHFTLDTWYKYNMISAKERDNYKSMYKYYIPLRGWEETEDIEYSKLPEQAFNPVTNIVTANKQAHGRTSRADSPLAYISSLAQSAIVLGNKNQVRLNMYRLVLKNLNILGDIATIPKVYIIKNKNKQDEEQTTERPAQELFDQGLVITKTNKEYQWHKSKAEYQAHLIPVFINGDRQLIEMRGEFGVKIASAINNTNSVHLSKLDIIRPATQWLSATRTSYNPEFIPTNFARDFMFGNMAYAIEGGNILKLNRNLGRAFKAINRSELGTKNKDQYDRYYEEFMNEGAQTGFMNMRNIETMKKDLEKMHKQMLRTVKKKKMSSMDKKFATNFISMSMQYLNAMSENAMRFAVYLTEREKGASAKQAAFAAKEITVNFNRKGRYTENMGAIYGFFNASVQGTARLFDLAKKHGKRTAVALAALTGIKMLSNLVCVLFAGDDYDELSDYVKFSNILIPIGVQEDGRMKFLKIPMAQGVRGVTNIADVTVDVLRGTKTVVEAARTFLLNNIGEHLPLSFEAIDLTSRDSEGTLVAPFIPTLGVPVYESIMNRDFKGDPIYRDDYTLTSKEYSPRYTRATGRTSPLSIWASKGLNRLGGGNDELTSAIKVDENGNISRRWYGYRLDINPAKVEHILEGYFGGILSFPLNIVKTAYAAVSDEKEVELYNVPIVNRFVSVPSYKEGYDLYFRTSDLVRDIQASEKAVKAVGDMDAYSAIKNNRFNATIKNAYLEYNDRVKYLKELMENPDLSTQQMKDMEARMDEVMKEASAAFEEIYNKYDNNIERYEED